MWKSVLTTVLASLLLCARSHAQPTKAEAAEMDTILQAVAKDPALMKLIGATNANDIAFTKLTNIPGNGLSITNLLTTNFFLMNGMVITNFEPPRWERVVIVDDWPTRFEVATNWVKLPGEDLKWYPQVVSNVVLYVVWKGQTNRVVIESATNDWLQLDLIRTGQKPTDFPTLQAAPKKKPAPKPQPASEFVPVVVQET